MQCQLITPMLSNAKTNFQNSYLPKVLKLNWIKWVMSRQHSVLHNVYETCRHICIIADISNIENDQEVF